MALFLFIWLAGWTIGEAAGVAVFVMVIASLAGSAMSSPFPWAPDWGTAGVASFVLLFGLVVRDADRHRTIAKTMNDEAEVVDFGRWLASRAGFRLELPRDLKQAWPPT